MTCPLDPGFCDCEATEEAYIEDDGRAEAHSNFTGDLDALLKAAFYCAVQGSQDASKVDMFQTLKKQFIENYGYAP